MPAVLYLIKVKSAGHRAFMESLGGDHFRLTGRGLQGLQLPAAWHLSCFPEHVPWVEREGGTPSFMMDTGPLSSKVCGPVLLLLLAFPGPSSLTNSSQLLESVYDLCSYTVFRVLCRITFYTQPTCSTITCSQTTGLDFCYKWTRCVGFQWQ